MRRAHQNRKGSALVVILWLVVIFIIAGLALFNYNSFFSLRFRSNAQTLFLAQLGVEEVRGHLQRHVGRGAPAPPANSRDLPGGASRLFLRGGGAPVQWPMPSALFDSIGHSDWKTSVFGVPVADPISGSTLGYMSYFLVSGPAGAIEIYSMGALSSNPSGIYAQKTVHARLKPYTYSEYTSFNGNPNQNLVINQNYTDPVYFGVNMFDSGYAPDYLAGAIPGGAESMNFNKVFIAGNLNLNVSGISEPRFNGFSTATFQVGPPPAGTPPPASTITTTNPINIPSVANVWESKQVVSQGLPGSTSSSGSSQVQQIMDLLHLQACGGATCGGAPAGGVVLNENVTTAGTNKNPFFLATDGYYKSGDSINNRFVASTEDPNSPSYIPCATNPCTFDGTTPSPNWNKWDPTTVIQTTGSGAGKEDLSKNEPYKISLNSDGTASITNFSAKQTAYVNGSAVTQGAGSTLRINIVDPTASNYIANPILYAKGNVQVSGTLKGSLTVVAEGKITVSDNIQYSDHTYTPHTSGGYRTGTDVTQNPPGSPDPYDPNNPDLLGLITARKIQFDPQRGSDADNFIVSAAVMELGSYPSPPAPAPSWNIPTYADKPDLKWTEQVSPLASVVHDPDRFHSITLFGSQAKYTSDRNWTNYYSNGRGRPVSGMTFAGNPISPFSVYDPTLWRTEPPFAITLSAGYNTVYWAIINEQTGQDTVAPLR